MSSYLQLILVCMFFITTYALPKIIDKQTVINNFKRLILNEIQLNPGTPLLNIDDMDENCKAEKFNQTITHHKCETKTIVNYLCKGSCNTLYIPQYPFDLCVQCQPSQTSEMSVELNCPNARNARKRKRVKKIQIVHSCSCSACTTF